MNELERLAKVPEAFDVVVPAKLISKEVTDSDGTVRAEYQLELSYPDLSGDNPENEERFPRFEMRFNVAVIDDSKARDVEKILSERVQFSLAFGIAYELVSDRIVILSKKDRASADAAKDMAVAIDEMSLAERRWLRFSAWVMRAMRKFYRRRA